MLFFLTIGAVIYAFILSDRVNKLTKKVDLLTKNSALIKQETAQAITNEVTQLPHIQQPLVTAAPEQKITTEMQADMNDPVSNWITENWLLKLGVLLILIGVGWFMSYAFVHNWITPVGRVALGFVVGIILAILGAWRISSNPKQGSLGITLGVAIFLITTIAGHYVYGFFGPNLILLFTLLSSLFISTVASVSNNKSLAIAGLITALIAPVFVYESLSAFLVFIYAAIVTLGFMWLSYIHGWKVINFISSLWIGALLLNQLTVSTLSRADQNIIVIILFALCFMYFLLHILNAFKENTASLVPDSSDIATSLVSFGIVLLATFTFIPEIYQSLILILWVVIYAGGSLFVYKNTKDTTFFYTHSLAIAVFIATITAIELDGKALLYAYLVESALVSILGYLATRKVSIGYALSTLLIGPALMAVPSIFANTWNNGIRHEDFFVLLCTGIVILCIGIFYKYSEDEAANYNDSIGESYYPAHIISGSFFLLALVWLSTHAVMLQDSHAITISLVIYTILGIITYFYGLRNSKNITKYYGATLIILVLLRLLFVDLWNMDLATRIITFIVIGTLFISTAFISNSIKKES